MTKKRASSFKLNASEPVASMTVGDAQTGTVLVVQGAGALANSDFRLEKGVSLLKPIAAQALTRSGKRRAS